MSCPKHNTPPQDYSIIGKEMDNLMIQYKKNSFPTPSNLTELSTCGCKGKCSKYVPVLQERICFH